MKLFFVTAFALFVVTSAEFNCPPKNGLYEDPVQCDKYYECTDGIAKAKLCSDGLVFDSEKGKNVCDQAVNVDCGNRTELQPAKRSGPCLRRNGFFPHEDPAVCDKFFNCIEGEFTEMTCSPGLHFDVFSGTCVWPDEAGRKGCNEQGKTLKDGFQCPMEEQKTTNGRRAVHPTYPHPTDCHKYYICLNGQEPRESGCQGGLVYNKDSQKCDDKKNVAGC